MSTRGLLPGSRSLWVRVDLEIEELGSSPSWKYLLAR